MKSGLLHSRHRQRYEHSNLSGEHEAGAGPQTGALLQSAELLECQKRKRKLFSFVTANAEVAGHVQDSIPVVVRVLMGLGGDDHFREAVPCVEGLAVVV